jgi:hypothetical protein
MRSLLGISVSAGSSGSWFRSDTSESSNRKYRPKEMSLRYYQWCSSHSPEIRSFQFASIFGLGRPAYCNSCGLIQEYKLPLGSSRIAFVNLFFSNSNNGTGISRKIWVVRSYSKQCPPTKANWNLQTQTWFWHSPYHFFIFTIACPLGPPPTKHNQ